MWKSFSSFAALFLVCVAGPARAEAPVVAVSLKPLHSLVATVMDGVGKPAPIVSGVASPHDYALKPSDMRLLGRARLVVWVGPGFEAWLTKPLGDRTDSLAMADLPGLVTLPLREGGVWEQEEAHADAHADHAHADRPPDNHFWLDPRNAALLVEAVAERLAALDPAHAATYRRNATDTGARLAVLDADLQTRLAPLAGQPYVVFHDAYQYFEARYGLTPAGSVTLDPERPPAARRLAALRDRLKQARIGCVFREPGFSGAVTDRLAESAGARIGVLDPEGVALEPGRDLYFRLMTGLADGLQGCLSGR